jgi:hypothetical protein
MAKSVPFGADFRVHAAKEIGTTSTRGAVVNGDDHFGHHFRGSLSEK